MIAGAARVDITPPVGIELSGFVAREQPSTAVHDRLWARALWVEAGDQRLVWVHCDVIGFGTALAKACRDALAQALDLQPPHIVLSASHTHSGPPTQSLNFCGTAAADCPYLAKLPEHVGRAGLEARSCRTHARGYRLDTTCDVGIDRRGHASAHVDRRLTALALRTRAGDPIATLANVAVHPVSLTAENRSISGDLLGMAAEMYEESHGPLLLTNGACANVNPVRKAPDFDHCRGLAQGIVDPLRHGHWEACRPWSMGAAHQTFALPVETLGADEIRARARLLEQELPDFGEMWVSRSRDAFRRWEDARLRAGSVSAMPLELQAVALGPFRFAAFGAEVFSVMGDRLRYLAGEDVRVVGYANGNVGYLCPDTAYDEGGYEVDRAFAYYGTPPIARGGFELVEREMANLLSRVKGSV